MTIPELHVRARSERVEVAETYRYNFEEAAASSVSPSAPPAGRIRAVFPYAQGAWLTPEALADLDRQAGDEAPGAPLQEPSATVGHLAFSRTDRTDLESALGIDGPWSSIPLTIPVHRDLLRRGRGAENDDGGLGRRAAVVDWVYSPVAPDVVPLEVSARLMDWESLAADEIVRLATSPSVDDRALARALERPPGGARGSLLVLDLAVVPGTAAHGESSAPMVSRAALAWPTIPWSEGLSLVLPEAGGYTAVAPHYRPESRAAEWSPGLAMEGVGSGAGDGGDGPLSWTRQLVFRLDDASELAAQADLHGRVEVELPGALLSGLRVRQYGATGTPAETGPAAWTRLVADLRLSLRQLLRRRSRSVVHRLFFHGVVLEERRVADIRSVLADCGLDVDGEAPPTGDGAALVTARRSVGGETLRITVFLTGRRHRARRTTELAGGRSYETQIQSGDLGVFLHGRLRGSSRTVAEVLETIHGRLREIFSVTSDHR